MHTLHMMKLSHREIKLLTNVTVGKKRDLNTSSLSAELVLFFFHVKFSIDLVHHFLFIFIFFYFFGHATKIVGS